MYLYLILNLIKSPDTKFNYIIFERSQELIFFYRNCMQSGYIKFVRSGKKNNFLLLNNFSLNFKIRF